jgi:hypothetical protein
MTATRLVCGVALLLAQLAPALAEDGCDKFAWPLTRERALLAAADKAVAKAGDTLAAMPKGAMALQLAPGADASFVMPPERKSRVEPWFGSAIKFAAPDKPGIYQVTLSEDACSTSCRTAATRARSAAPDAAIARACAKACGSNSPPRRLCCSSAALPPTRFS